MKEEAKKSRTVLYDLIKQKQEVLLHPPEKGIKVKRAQVPPSFTSKFHLAEAQVDAHFSSISRDVPRGIVRVGEERYLYIRGKALSAEFISSIAEKAFM